MNQQISNMVVQVLLRDTPARRRSDMFSRHDAACAFKNCPARAKSANASQPQPPSEQARKIDAEIGGILRHETAWAVEEFATRARHRALLSAGGWRRA